jgi:hypothetical protein
LKYKPRTKQGDIMSNTKNTGVKPSNPIDSKLLKALGIDSSQLSTKVTATKAKPSTKIEILKYEAKTSIARVNKEQGQNVRFQSVVRDGKTKDGKKQFKLVNCQGDFVVVENQDGTFTASKVHYYTESFTLADFVIVGSNSDLTK